MGRLILTAKGLKWFRRGHPWIFRDDLKRVEDAAPGAIVALESERGDFLAQGFYSEPSKIAFRLLSRNREPIDRDFWRKRLLEAVQYRERVVQGTDAYRLVYGEADGLPSLIVDRYGDHLVLQTLSAGAERILPEITALLLDLLRPLSIVLRNDLGVRGLEGLPQEKRVLFGECPPAVQVTEGEIRYRVNPLSGQKTGAYLDQRENRQEAARFLKGNVLDAFCYHGLFALHAARQASRVTGIDSSPDALEQAGENARLNGLAHLTFLRANVFDFLKAQAEEGRRYDGIVLDPPAFAKSREQVGGALRGYRELNLRAIRLLQPGGVLVTSSCSYNLSESQFLQVLREGAREAGAALRLVEKRTQSSDHPILLTFPESFYLKCLILEKAGPYF
ncbi:MAG: class I SAM-dependent rRNA methyltransferase [Deltaproteobacteria bacterium]|nr:class I SAM-dependent rRNA methyltransferase [Deltaproteobacteria bacterium]